MLPDQMQKITIPKSIFCNVARGGHLVSVHSSVFLVSCMCQIFDFSKHQEVRDWERAIEFGGLNSEEFQV